MWNWNISNLFQSKYKQAVTHHAERIHFKKRSFICDLCQKQFHQECDLRKHKSAVHEGKRRFVCETCGFPCVSKQSLEKHILSKHEKQILKCPHCDYRETSSKRFYNHYNLMHTKSLILNQHLHTVCWEGLLIKSLKNPDQGLSKHERS